MLENVDLQVEPLDFLGLIGPNGGGKTTLLKLILGLVEPKKGEVHLLGQTPERARSRVGYVPQIARIDPSLAASVIDIVLMGRLSASSWGPRFGPTDLARAEAALIETNTIDLSHKGLGELSGGQRQRVLIARALASEAEMLLLDEPTAGVDFHRERELLNLLHRLNERIPIVLVSHDIAIVTTHLKRAAWVQRTVTCYSAPDLSLEVMEGLYHRDHAKHPPKGDASQARAHPGDDRGTASR
ncbi:MAG: ABC transporter ATP-binding protein [Acidobacteriota bacterium]